MAVSQTEAKAQSIELATQAFEAFCDDISGMFGIDMKCSQKGISTETVKSLSKKFKKLAAVTFVKTNGVLDGIFNLVFDQGGMFTLAGIIVMLPKQKIIDTIKRGSDKEAMEMTDTIKEVGNLLVGSWDRVFREGMEGHGHFLQTNTFIGNPWEGSKDKIGISETEEFSFVSYEITVDDYPPFSCGVIYPEAIFGTAEVQTPQAVIEAKKEEKPAAEVQKPAAEPKPTAPPERKPVAEVKPEEKKPAAAPEQKPAAAPEPKLAETVAPPVKEEAAQPVANKEPVLGPVSETIQKMVKSTSAGENGSVSLNLCAKQFMQTNILWGKGDDSVQQAMDKMQQVQASYILIGEQGVAEGIVSTYDIASAVSIYLRPVFAKWRRPTDDATLQIKLKWIMTRPVSTVNADTSISAVMEKMCQTGLHCLPVTENGKAVGLITMFDVFKSILNTQK
ncbi:MAG: hypothetical protein A2Y10_07565 [Planctomycetes bacterium GWF2_41_51]|nr:MAG: hypothetical protein A2Y10_07565 [Planctomycetes bacterium GWF2_41_51]HBG27213.1 hypothetical protein [Phycisphaerales bacterium]